MSSGAELRCAACGEMTPEGRFCIHCGASTQQACPNCGQPVVPGAKFCLECGTSLSSIAGAASGGNQAPATAPGSVSERRLVSVLFADLVGFTTLSEHRDPEEVRELLSQYFDRCRSLIERYGGTVEKFIGDAVMAVWGTPVAREDDAERAVRAALSLTQAVTLLGEEVGMPTLRVRAGVLTGNAAVEVGAEGEGMVLGDTVNTASRLQSIAAPGTVLVDEVTRRSSEAAIAYEDAGVHDLKGREQSVHAWTALRVVAGVGGTRRGAGLEAPFVGRGRELEKVIALSEEMAGTGRARFVAVIGEAGSGKSRLLWEYYKYMDGVERLVSWHQGRCLSYGDGVAYWALAEMVRARAGILEEEEPTSARNKLREAVERYVPDERERRLVEPRLAHLLGLEQRTATDRADLFSGWRLFFERVSEQAPVVLVFEDLQWADSGLLEFIDYLLEWSADRPLFILAAGRRDVLEQRPDWDRDAISLEPLPEAAMREALDGLVPGLPQELMGRILRRAEGVPLYAVETVRMLLDRNLLTQDGSRYVLTGDVSELDVPETLQALAAARLDGLGPNERSVLQDAAVFGQSFTAAGVAALGGRSDHEAQQALDSLVAKQLLGLNDDPLSSERGQYHFLQGLLRSTAYGTLSRRDRKARHLSAARHLQESWGEGAPELAEVLAAHFLDAAAADPEAADAGKIRAAARDTLADAGHRAMSLALGREAERAFDRAAELAEDDASRAALLEQAGRAALISADFPQAVTRLEEAIEIYEKLGDSEAAARAMIPVGNALNREDRLEEAIEILRRAVPGLSDADDARAAVLAELSLLLCFAGDIDDALEAADAALSIAEPRQYWPAVCVAFDSLANVRVRQGRPEEARALRERAVALALDNDLGETALRASNNLADLPLQADRFAEAIELAQRGYVLAQARGDHRWGSALELLLASARLGLGDWDELPVYDAAELEQLGELMRRGILPVLARVQAARGERGELELTLARADEIDDTINREFAGSKNAARAIALRALGRDREALEAALPVATDVDIPNEDRREAYLEAGLAALAIGDEQAVERLVDFVASLPQARRSPLLRAGAARFEGLLALRRDDAARAEELLALALRELRTIEAPFVLGQVLLDRGELLVGAGREDEAAPDLAEAADIFTRLRATPWLERVQAVRAGVPV
jgi:class 3 adenylate cyclase/tetratricopeptide (TPR) repeat protein